MKKRNKILIFGVINIAILTAHISGVYDYAKRKYQTWQKENEGIAQIYVSDGDGIESMLLTNNTHGSSNLTQVPTMKIDINFGLGELYLDLPHLKSGRYVFTANVKDKQGNIEKTVLEYDIQNPNGGIDEYTQDLEVTSYSRS
jgi:hypothetical protein